MIPPAEQIVVAALSDIVGPLAREYACRAQVGCAVNNVGRVVWTVAIHDNGDACEGNTLAEATFRAAVGCETAAVKAKRLRKEAEAAVAEAEKLEASR